MGVASLRLVCSLRGETCGGKAPSLPMGVYQVGNEGLDNLSSGGGVGKLKRWSLTPFETMRLLLQ